ncbi:MAG: 16S rRNA (guanine(966)-N(2))-methyltransferase RsmD [Acidipila sp.]|nr:16S rRNA (guanine(966)-N(2))-methyltransferase RsmD [Acidipila sp.]
MRVVAGKFGSRRLAGPRGHGLRPTSDRLRETLFDILQTEVAGSFFVDVYAGTGAVGIEALSRGARRVVFLENHRQALALIRANLGALDISEAAEVLPLDAVRGIALLGARGVTADFIFLDPPYDDRAEYGRAFEALDASPLVSPLTRVIMERSSKLVLPERSGRLFRRRIKEQGDAALDFYAVDAAAPAA